MRLPKPILLMMSTFQGGSGGKNCGAFSSRVWSALRIERLPGEAMVAGSEEAAAAAVAATPLDTDGEEMEADAEAEAGDVEAEAEVDADALALEPESAPLHARFAADGPPPPPLQPSGVGLGDGDALADAGACRLPVIGACALLLLAANGTGERTGTSSPPPDAPAVISPPSSIRRTVSLSTPSGSVHNTTSHENRCNLFVAEFNAATSAPDKQRSL